MEMQTVFLITSAHPGWLAICEAFRTLPGFCIIGQTRSPMLAVTGIAAYRPAIVIMPVYCDPHNSSEDLYGVKLLLQLRSCSPESKILVVEERLWSTESLALTKLDIRGIVTWSELT
ncbi:MAG: hypothetical protein ACR2PL_23745, partial [Dehalococcoidia bacterium]